ncbi:terpenoid synthase [Dendrothele bispora CBS 962.96]|uniref:Terpene synthase n=1 Tax=Dendrothele bispora (strain CBS 962.96) TaxID=1314807 RepID=A0A4S8MCF9_DENBC|nr:terpenoid synthase [Dendrothele bispora CBS 962.96]
MVLELDVCTQACAPATATKVKSFAMPDLPAYFPYSLRRNEHEIAALKVTKNWFFQGCRDNLPGSKYTKAKVQYDLDNFAFLASTCYPEADRERIQTCSDFLILLFHLDDITDEMTPAQSDSTADIVMNTLRNPEGYTSPTRVGVLIKDFWTRFISTGSIDAQQRFIKAFDLYFKSIHNQSSYRQTGYIPPPDDYAQLRRDTSGCMMCYALTEYANNIDIPGTVMEHDAILGMQNASNDLVSFANDIYSFNLEQSKGDTHNMIAVLMYSEGIDLQTAVDCVAARCKEAMDDYYKHRERLPSWGIEIDRRVEIYADGLADWMIGVMRWSFVTYRYFRRDLQEVNESQVVRLWEREK